MTRSKPRNGLIAALDVGTSKVCCFIAHAVDGELRVSGIGHHLSRGLRAGAIVDMDAARESILGAVRHAEQMADETIREVVLSFSAGSPASRSVAVEVALNGHEIGDNDLRRVLSEGRQRCNGGDDERAIVHTIPIGYTIDGSRGIRDPRGMYGDSLGLNIHVVTAQQGPMRNLATCVARCHLEVADNVVSPYASGLACLDDDERELGVTLLDIGGGTTTVAVFMEDDVIHTDVVPIGGNHITNDIARGLFTPIDDAERMKVLYGSAVPSPADDRETIDVRSIGESDDAGANPVPRSHLNRIIRPRVEEILEVVRARLEASGFGDVAGRRMVLTGGSSQLQGLRDLATQIFGKSIRLGRPRGIDGLAEATGGPAFSTCAGLLHYAIGRRQELPLHPAAIHQGAGGRLDRVSHWFREHF